VNEFDVFRELIIGREGEREIRTRAQKMVRPSVTLK
jgi:hypothetical protein